MRCLIYQSSEMGFLVAPSVKFHVRITCSSNRNVLGVRIRLVCRGGPRLLSSTSVALPIASFTLHAKISPPTRALRLRRLQGGRAAATAGGRSRCCCGSPDPAAQKLGDLPERGAAARARPWSGRLASPARCSAGRLGRAVGLPRRRAFVAAAAAGPASCRRGPSTKPAGQVRN